MSSIQFTFIPWRSKNMSEKTERKGWYVTPDGERVDMPAPANEDGTFSLEQLQFAVGGPIEVITLAVGKLFPGMVLLVNEEGLLKPLPFNATATILCGRPIVGNLAVIDQEAMQ